MQYRKIASYVKIVQSLIESKEYYTDCLIKNLNSTRNKNKLLSRRFYAIPGTLQIKFGYENEDFVNNLITVIAEERVRTLKEERRIRRRLTLC